MELKDLYGEYGRLLVQQEILTGQINQVKQALAQALNEASKPQQVPEQPKEEGKA